ncbi:MAG TPA: UDP-2,3-diacylglucosamine diphosphatase [Cyclobacteriaceae bacterium]
MIDVNLPVGKKIYFASDFHLGVPDLKATIEREKLLVKWLESIRYDAHSLYLVGDMFDFWFEYKYTIPKGFIRFLGKLAELRDAGLPIYFFTGNHDLWMFDYFQKELDIAIYTEPQELKIGNHKMLIGHGDGLGPGDGFYKILKSGLFGNRFFQWMFARLHPNLGMYLAHSWSKSSRIANMKRENFESDKNEFLFTYCQELEKNTHHDFYIFGHRHLPLDLKVSDNSRYINLGEWVNFSPYAAYDGKNIELKMFS